MWKWVAKVASSVGLAGMLCCVAPAVLFMLGLMGGAGLDSYNSQVKLSVLSQGNDLAEVAAPLILRRPVLFSSVSLSLLILQLSTEFGWAWGFPMLEGYSLGPFDPTRGSVFLSLGARLTIR